MTPVSKGDYWIIYLVEGNKTNQINNGFFITIGIIVY